MKHTRPNSGALSPGNAVFLAKLDPQLGYLSSARFGSGIHYNGEALVALDGAGNVVLFGSYYNGTMDLGGGTLPKAGDADLFLGKLDPSFSHLWSHGFGDSSVDYALDLFIDGSGNTLIVGVFEGSLDLGLGPMTAQQQDAFVGKLGP